LPTDPKISEKAMKKHEQELKAAIKKVREQFKNQGKNG
jgi:hypothetical protein